MRKLPDITADWLLARVRDDGEGCLIWTRYSQNGDPKATFSTEAIPCNVRRVIWQALTGKKLRKGRIIKTCCGTHNCVEPAHLVNLPAGARNKGRKQTITARAATAAALRAKSKIADAIDEIRDSGLTQDEEAARRGISQAMVSRIRLGKNWQDYRNPFAQMGAR